jgi:hypothetical protein
MRRRTGFAIWAVGEVPLRIELLLRVAVIGGDGQDVARRENGVVETAELAVESFDRADCGFELPGMPDHVDVGVIDDDHVVPARGDISEGEISDLAPIRDVLAAYGQLRLGPQEIEIRMKRLCAPSVE